MRKMTEKQQARSEKTRNIGKEILQGIRDIKASRIGRRFTAESYPIVRAREKSGLSQTQFASRSASQARITPLLTGNWSA